jgi:S-methylmethionine-dependent homocysteine/selenocysteine methylase
VFYMSVNMSNGENKKITILDGSFGFQLSKYVSKPLEGDPLWSARSLAKEPEAVIQVHMDYIKGTPFCIFYKKFFFSL